MTDRARAGGVDAPRRRVYLLGPSHGTPAAKTRRFRPAYDAMTTAGFDVIAPGWLHPAPVTDVDLLSVVDDDMTALASADLVVTLPGAEALWEVEVAPALGVPVVRFCALMTEARIA